VVGSIPTYTVHANKRMDVMNRKLQVTESRIKQKEENVRLLFYKKFTFVRVLCASAVRVGVCGGVCVCLGALKKKKKKLH